MERYSEYKNCPLSGIKEIPRHWEMHRIKWLLSERIEKSKDGLGEPLSMSQKLGVVPTKDMEVIPNIASSYIGAKKVQQGDLVFNKLKAHLGVFAVSNYDGLVSPDYAIYIPTERTYLPYLEHLLRTQYYITEFQKKTTGVAIGLTRLYTDGLFGISAIYPPLAEQEKIVSYLDRKTSKIDAYVVNKEKEIELLQELKQKTIAEAVTKGLNPNVKMKDSGISWIGMIPDHWEMKQLRSFLTLFTEKGHGDAQLLSVTREQGVIERDREDKEENHNFVPDDLSGYKYIEKGDFAINKMKAWQGSYAVSDHCGIVSPAYYTCKLKGVNKDFFSRAIRSKAYVPFFTQYSKGIRVGQWDLNPNALKNIPFMLPPIDEQHAIVTYIDDKCQKIDTLITELQAEIDYLKEYKQRLISDVVTGQVNVQNL